MSAVISVNFELTYPRTHALKHPPTHSHKTDVTLYKAEPRLWRRFQSSFRVFDCTLFAMKHLPTFQIAVYHSIPFVDLSPIGLVHSPEVIEGINKRRMVSTFRSSANHKAGPISNFIKVIAKPVVGFSKLGPNNRLKRIISLHRRPRSRNGTPDTEDMRSTLTNCPSTVTSASPDSRSSHGGKLYQMD